MNQSLESTKRLSDIKALYPHLSQKECDEVFQRMTRYVSIVLRIMDHLESDPKAYAQFEALRNRYSDLRSELGDFDLS